MSTKVEAQAGKAEESEDRAEMAPENIKGDVVKLSPAEVMGDSSKARERADAILDERDAVAKALADAEEALAQLRKFKAEANELEEGTKGLDGLKSRIDAEITLVERRIEDIKAIQKMGGALDDAVKKAMKGSDSSDSREAVLAKRAAEVAKAVEDAATFQLGVDSGVYPEQTGGKKYSSDTALTRQGLTFNAGTRAHLAEFSGRNLNIIPDVVIKNDAPDTAKSLKDIFGDKVEKKSTAAGLIDMASFKGMDAGDQIARSHGLNPFDHEYMGISGRLYCRATRCSVTNGKLGDGWYWAPLAGKEYARWTMEGNEYTEYTDYAVYGYWVASPTEGDKAGTITNVFTFGIPADTGAAPRASVTSTSITGGTKATYKGSAIGISVMIDAKGNAAKSGEFAADLTLNASFGASPTVTGTVTNFKGKATNNEWEVKLESTKLLTSFPAALNNDNFGLTTAEGDFQPADEGDIEAQGRWHARAYGGTATTRPTGITGDFFALFKDGRALGGYATRKQDD